jgi:hypothetical protein
MGQGESALMALIILLIIVGLIILALQSFPEPWRCHGCDFETIDELEALGHQKKAELHKVYKD